MSLNIPLARQVLQHLIAHPEQHDQSHWGKRTKCGTVACIAGTTLLLSGEPVKFDRHGNIANPNIPGRAAELLGVTAEFDEDNLICDGEAFRLFYQMDNDQALDLLRQYIEQAEANRSEEIHV